MIRRKKRTAKQRAMLRYKQRAPIGIGKTRAQLKRQADHEEAAQIVATHDLVWQRSSACQVCGGTRRAECRGFADEMHEDPPRSLTMGMPPAERFNVRVCGRLCKACHADVTDGRLWLVFADPVERFNARGPWPIPIAMTEVTAFHNRAAADLARDMIDEAWLAIREESRRFIYGDGRIETPIGIANWKGASV